MKIRFVASLFTLGCTCCLVKPVSSTRNNLRNESLTGEAKAHRKLALTGSETFLAVRVVATGCNPACSPPSSVNTIADDLYGDTVNLVTVTDGCSFGKFTIGPTPDINGNVLATAGVYEVTITDDIFGITPDSARQIVEQELAEELGATFKSGADKFIYFLPPELNWPVNPAGRKAPGFAKDNTLNLNVGFYSSTRGHVHEYFHTLGLNHATEGGRGATEYGDVTGQMGGSSISSGTGDESGQKCFNGPHSWWLGWYGNRHAEISSPGILDTSGAYQIVGLADYGNSADIHSVILKVGLGFPDYYVTFNRATGINQDTGEYPNQVLVHMALGFDPAAFTDIRAALSAGDKFPIPGGEIEVASIDTASTPAVATVNVNRIIPSGKLDVFFLIDNTGSFQDDIDLFKGIVDDVIGDIQDEGDDVHFGLGIFRDYPVGPYGEAGDFPYQLLVPIPPDGDDDGAQAVIDATLLLSPDGGNDDKESQLTALYQAVTGLGDAGYVDQDQDAQFRSDAAKFIVLWTDSGFHDSGIEDGYPGPDYATVLGALQAAGVPFRERRGLDVTAQSVRVLGIVRPGEDTFDDAVQYLQDLATGTGAVAPEGGVDCSDDGSEIILEGEPLVCLSGTGTGIGPAMTAAVKAVIEVIRPVALCQDVTVVADPGTCSVETASINNGSNDPAGGDVTLVQIPEGPYSVGTNPVTLEVSNTENLASYCVGEIEVKDMEDPVLNDIPADVTVECDAVPKAASISASDNCVTFMDEPLEVDVVEVRTDGSCEFEYTLTRTWSTEDKSGNDASEEQVVSVEDTTPPVIACNVHEISPDDVNMVSPIVFTPTATDNCFDPEDLVVEVDSYDCYRINPNGSKLKVNCNIALDGDSASIFISGGVGTFIDLSVLATQPCGNLQTAATCTVNVVNPSDNP